MHQTLVVSVPTSGAACRAAAEDVARQIAAEASRRDQERILPYAEFDLIRSRGLHALRVPREFGGPGASIADLMAVTRILSKADPNVSQALSPHLLVPDMLLLWGSERQQRKYMADILKGHVINNAFAERGGKKVGEIFTTLKRSGDEFRLNGTKFYSTGALMADQIFATARMDDGAMALVFVPCDRAGLELVDDWTGMGQRTTASGTTRFRDVAVQVEEVIRLPDFTSRRTFFGAMAQALHAAIDTGLAEAAFEDAILYGRNEARPVPESGVDRQIDDPYAISTVGHMGVLVHQAMSMLDRAAARLEPAVEAQLGRLDDPQVLERLLCEASVGVAEAKIAATEASLRVAEMLYLIGGASATLSRHNFDRHWRNARTHTTHDPVAYKYKLVGDYYLSGKPPPISTKV